MTNRILCLAALLLFAPLAQAASDTHERYREKQQEADTHYSEGEYDRAWDDYEDLAKVGDTFAQYRLSHMSLAGQGTDKDPREAYAWAVLATQKDIPDLVQYRDTLEQAMSPEELEEGKELAEKYLKRYSDLALAEKAQKKIRRRLSSCTGSRLSTRCEDVIHYAPAQVGIDPGGSNTSSTDLPESAGVPQANNPTPNTFQGANARDPFYYLELRATLEQLDQYIAENDSGGTVSLGEFEVQEDETEAQPGDDS